MEINKYLNPITFSIPEEKIINYIPIKKQILSKLIPGDLKTYIYNNEKDYYDQYKDSIFAITKKKAGWDCLRHYEIILNGCIPIFENIENCPVNTLKLFPKNLLFEAHILYNKLKKLNINDIYKTEYELLISKFLNYIKNNLTTSKMASYILNKIYNKNVSKILYLSGETCPDYLRCLTLHGFKTLFGTNCHDYPKIQHIYKTNDINFNQLYGKGLTYTNLLDPKLHDETLNNTIEEDIKKKLLRFNNIWIFS